VVRHVVQRLLPGAVPDPGALIFRGVAFEFRGKDQHPEWKRWWDRAIFWGAPCRRSWGVAFGNILRVPIDADKEFVGSFFDLLHPYALLTGVTSLLLFHAPRRGLSR
jgi:cytochrome d ubiquinol oxidase subunit II